MKKSILSKESLMSKFEINELSNVASIFGGGDGGDGGEGPTTSTSGYTTKSSATDFDQGDHDVDW